MGNLSLMSNFQKLLYSSPVARNRAAVYDTQGCHELIRSSIYH